MQTANGLQSVFHSKRTDERRAVVPCDTPGKENAMRRTVKLGIMILTLVVATCVLAPPARALDPIQKEDITAGAMIADFFLVRPIGIVATAFGAVVYVVSLPFSLPGGNAHLAAQKLIVKPAKYTFTRPLGAFAG